MRTTVSIDDHLLAEVKLVAAREHATLGAIVDAALRSWLAARESRPRTDFVWSDVAIEGLDGQGVRPGVDWRSNAAVLAAMEES